jgi:hypothetical protein
MSNWTLGGLFWTLRKYAPELRDIWVYGYENTFRTHGLPAPGGRFTKIGEFEDYPKNKWSDSFMEVCEMMVNLDRNIFLFLMDDFWLVRRADVRGINLLYEFMCRNNQLLKIDLATDRLYANGGSSYLYGANTLATVEYLDLIQSDPQSEYHMSLWNGLFNARLLLDRVLVPGETAQEIEIQGTRRLSSEDDVFVLGTRQAPMRVTNILRSGHDGPHYKGYSLNGDWVNGILNSDLAKMEADGVELR